MILRKRKAIESYWRELPSQLKRDYGESTHYADWQIHQAAERCGLDTRYIGYAFVIFMSVEAFARLPESMGGSAKYHEKRQELADIWFSGDLEFMDRHGFSGPDVGMVPKHPLIEEIGDDFEPFAKRWRGPF